MRLILPFISFRSANRQHPEPCPERSQRNRPELAPVSLLFSLVLISLLAGCTQNLGAAPSGWSPVAASESVVYVGNRQGEVKALEDKGLEGVNVKWTFPPPGTGERLLGVFNPPAVGKDRVYVSAVNGSLYAIDKNNGSIGDIGWRRPPAQSRGPRALVAGPALDQETNTVVVGSEDGNLYAYHAVTGEPLWSPFPTGGRIWSTAVIRDGVIYFGSQDHNVYAVSLADGREVWRFPTGGAVVARPLLLDNTVVIGSFDRKLYGINAQSGQLTWQFEGNNWFWAGAVASNKTIFAPSMDGNVYALDSSGRMLWKHDMGSAIVSTPVLLSRWLVVASKDGKISVLNPNPSDIGTSREISSFFIRDAQVKAPLVALEDSVFVGAQDDTVRHIDVKGTQAQLAQLWCFHTKDIQCK